jgi:hypothetical protein
MVWPMSASLASLALQFGNCWRVLQISEKGDFGEWEYSPKMDSIWRVLTLAKFAREYPLLSKNLINSPTDVFNGLHRPLHFKYMLKFCML